MSQQEDLTHSVVKLQFGRSAEAPMLEQRQKKTPNASNEQQPPKEPTKGKSCQSQVRQHRRKDV
jgi:hypothetical protein